MNQARRSCTAVCSCAKEEMGIWDRLWLKLFNMSTKSSVITCALSAIVLIVYVCLGSLIFTTVEQDNGENNTSKKIEMIEKLIKNVHLLRNFSHTSVDSNFHEEYFSLLNDSDNAMLELLQDEKLSYLPWNFFTGIHFCLTAITTIGYGYITPVTQLGRGLCILYVVIGIPINLFFSAKLAYFIAQGITKLYILLAKLTHVLFCKSCRQGDADPTNVYEMNMIGEFSQGVDLQDDSLGTSGSIQYINDSFRTADETLSPKSEVGISQEPRRFGLINRTNLVSHRTLPSIDGSENTSNEALRGVQQSDDENMSIPVWFMFLLLIAFCSLVAAIVYIEEIGKWTFLDSFYYVIITFTTIGFGDLSFRTSGDRENNETLWLKMIYTYSLMELGLVIMAAFITLWVEKLQQSAKRTKPASLPFKPATRNSTSKPRLC